MFTRFIAVAAAVWLSAFGLPVHADVPALPSNDAAIVHALNRLAYGPRPGDVARVRSEGLAVWIDRQLNPARIADAPINQRLAHLSTLGLDSRTLAREIHQPARRERQQLLRENTSSNRDSSINPDAMTPAEPMAERARRAPGGARQMSDTMRRDQQIITDLSEAKILRAVYSDRQLEEVLVDFWFNHFNVFAAKGPTRVWMGEFEREAIRPNVLGNFRTLLVAVAKSPAMLFYLDNWMNVDPDGTAQGTRQKAQGRNQEIRKEMGFAGPLARRATGLNENYARELMELHTLGVDGGYTQRDVVNVARAFTGWTIDTDGRRRPADGRRDFADTNAPSSGFRFDARRHDEGEKTVLGHTIKAGGGISDGEQVLDILVAQPATAHFIADKLARRFVSDTPPPALVERAAVKFTATHGDLEETLRVIITSPEFFAPEAYRAKVKTPLEFVASAFRSTGAEVRIALPVVRELRELGMPLYLCQPPTGYDDTASTWVSSGALVSRMNFALALGGNRLRGISLPFDPSASVPSVRASLLNDALTGSASAGTVATIEKATTVEQTIALVLGSPEFQKK